MGMMNNCYHRILIFPHRDEETGVIGIRFQHPAPIEVGKQGNIGWREEENLRQQALAAATSGEAVAPGPVTPDRVSWARAEFAIYNGPCIHHYCRYFAIMK